MIYNRVHNATKINDAFEQRNSKTNSLIYIATFIFVTIAFSLSNATIMLSKLHQPARTLRARLAPRLLAPGFLAPKLLAPRLRALVVRQLSLGFPKQYKQPVPNKFRMFYVLRHHWELIPLIGVVLFALLDICFATYTCFNDKVDIQLTQRNWNCISRNMDLRHPTIHKFLTFNQKYEPWPEMQDVLDKMADKEASVCPCGSRNCGK